MSKTKVFEAAVLKDGQHRLAYLPALLVNDGTLGPVLVEGRASVLGEVHELTAAELTQRDWLYSAFDRERVKTEAGERVWAYFGRLDRSPALPEAVPGNLWLYPRQRCNVYRVRVPGGAEFEGSMREILHQLHLDTKTPDGRARWADRGSILRFLLRASSLNPSARTLDTMAVLGVGRLSRVWPSGKPEREIVF